MTARAAILALAVLAGLGWLLLHVVDFGSTPHSESVDRAPRSQHEPANYTGSDELRAKFTPTKAPARAPTESPCRGLEVLVRGIDLAGMTRVKCRASSTVSERSTETGKHLRFPEIRESGWLLIQGAGPGHSSGSFRGWWDGVSVVELVLESPRERTVTVVDEAGDPLSNAAVFARTGGADRALGTTDRLGELVVRTTADSWIWARGPVSGVSRMHRMAGRCSVTVDLRESALLTGFVKTRDGRPSPGAKIRIRNTRGRGDAMWQFTGEDCASPGFWYVKTNEQGAYRIPVEPGYYFLRARLEDGLAMSAVRVSESGTTCDLWLSERGRIEVSGSEPIRSGYARWRGKGPATTKIDGDLLPDGRIRWSLPEGDYVLRVTGTSGDVRSLSARVPGGEVVRRGVEFRPTRALTGRVRRAGPTRSSDAWRIVAFTPNGRAYHSRCRGDEPFRIAVEKRGPWTICVAPMWSRRSEPTVSKSPVWVGEETIIEIPDEAVRAASVRLRTSPSVPEARVALRSTDSGYRKWQRLSRGVVSFGPVEHGVYEVTVSCDGWWGRSQLRVEGDAKHTVQLVPTGSVWIGVDRLEGIDLIEAQKAGETVSRVRVRGRRNVTMQLPEGECILIGKARGSESWRRKARLVRGKRTWIRQ